ncbi:MAG: carboxypeptidase-like regulatory domain-containing protein, partial [bacterium]
MIRQIVLIMPAMLFLLAASGRSQDFANQVREAIPASDDTLKKSIPLKKALATIAQAHRVHILYEDSLITNRFGELPARFSDDLYRDLYQLLRQHPLWFHKIGKRTIVLTYLPPHLMDISHYSGTIQGKIVDQNGTGIPAAQVIIEGTQLGAAANIDGDFTLANILPGTYTLTTKVIGYRNQDVQAIVRPGEVIQSDFSLTPDVLSMNEIVVTGTRNPLTKIASSVAISTSNNEKIADRAPRSTADMLKVIPGFYVESSGGESGNNLFSRGLPADGSYRYVAVYEDGLPVFEAPELAFANIDEFIRIDETIEVLEGVRGSTGSIFASNAPAGIINFISKTGGVVPSGKIKITTANHGLFRTDVSYGGPLGEQWRFHIGGFYRYDRGVRDPGFAANHGGQIKMNVTRLLDNGYLRFYGKFLDDSSIFYLPIPLQDADSPK